MRLSEAVRRRILYPVAGSALGRARDYGIDLTLILRGLERSPEERLEQAFAAGMMVETVRHLKKRLRRD